MKPGKFLKGLVVALSLVAISANVPMSYAGGKGGSYNSKPKIPSAKEIASFWLCYAKFVQKNALCIVKIIVREALCEADFYCRDSKKKKCWKTEQRGSKCSNKKWDGQTPE